MTRFLIPLTLFFLNCEQKQTDAVFTKRSLSYDTVNSDSVIHYDEHRYFDDVHPYTSDSLVRTIERSDRVVAFNWNDEDRNPANVAHYLVDAYGTFNERLGKSVSLNHKQITQLKSLLADTINYSGDLGICFIPHIAFVYYRKDSVIGQTNLCFLCAGQKSIPKTNNEAFSRIGYGNYLEFCKSLGLKIVVAKDP